MQSTVQFIIKAHEFPLCSIFFQTEQTFNIYCKIHFRDIKIFIQILPYYWVTWKSTIFSNLIGMKDNIYPMMKLRGRKKQLASFFFTFRNFKDKHFVFKSLNL